MTGKPSEELPVSSRPVDPLRVLPTPLHMKTSIACQTNDWTAWAGYTVPNLCTSLEREMAALTRHAAISDLSPMGKYLVSGDDATRFLDHLLVANISDMAKGDVLLSPMCQSNGRVINLVTVARIGAAAWWLTCDGRHMNWLYQSAIGFEVTLADYSETHAGLLLAGPEVSRVLTAADLGDCTDIVLRGARQISWDGIDIVLVHRPGGAVPGVSIWCAGKEAGIVWNRLMDGGRDCDLEAVGKSALEASGLKAECRPRAATSYPILKRSGQTGRVARSNLALIIRLMRPGASLTGVQLFLRNARKGQFCDSPRSVSLVWHRAPGFVCSRKKAARTLSLVL